MQERLAQELSLLRPSRTSVASAQQVSRLTLRLLSKAAALLGRRTAELHLALATETHDVAFAAAEPFTPNELATDSTRHTQRRSTTTLDAP